MIRLVGILVITILFSCNNNKVDTRKPLDTKLDNIVQVGDTLVVFTGGCKGCEFGTTYGFKDSLGIIINSDYKSTDPCPECAGGSYNIEIEFVATDEGRTTLKMYRHEWAMSDSIYVPEILDYEQKPIIVDSALVATFNILVNKKTQ